MKKNCMIKTVATAMLLTATFTQTARAEAGDGHFWLKLQDKNIGIDDAARHFGEWLNLPEGSTFELTKDETDELGIRHLRYRQYVDGYEVQASTVIVHGRNGIVTSANGVVLEQSAQPKVRRKAIARNGGDVTGSAGNMYLVQTPSGYRYAKYHYDAMMNADVYMDAENGEILKAVSLSHSLSETMQGRSVYSGTVPFTVTTQADGTHVMIDETRNIYTYDAHNAKNSKLEDYIFGTDKNGETVYDRERYIKEQCTPFSTKDNFWTMTQLVEYSLDSICPQEDPFAEVYLVLRNYEGEVVDSASKTYVSSLPFKVQLKSPGGASAFCNVGSFGVEVWKYNYMGDDVRIDSVGMGPFPVGKHYWKTDITSGHALTELVANPAVDIHWGMQQTYDWYKKNLGRDSYDDKGAPIYNILYAPKKNSFIAMPFPANAFAEFGSIYNCCVMEYGIGDGVTMRPVVALDVMAHEFTHLVTHCTAGLEGKNAFGYAPESAALNESFSDIIGISVKQMVKGSKAADNWLIGEGVMLKYPCMRDMSHRVAGSTVGPICYKGEGWKDGADEHANCAVQNYWFYLLCFGFDEEFVPDSTDCINRIGMDKAVKIAYRNLTRYLSPTANYTDACKGSLMAAADLYGEESEEYTTVKYAWEGVCVREDTTPPTAIRNVTNDVKTAKGNSWYNLQGQQIEKPSQPGVYIYNGRKVMIK